MAKNFKELQAKMGPERLARSRERLRETLGELEIPIPNRPGEE